MIYLDNAATTFVKPARVYFEVNRAMKSASSPGRGAYKQAMTAAEILYDCRQEAAELFQADEIENVVFSFNASHALNMAINSMISAHDRVLISGFEHNSVLRPLAAAGAKIIVAGRTLFDKDSVLNDFADKIKIVDAVVCTHVSNVFGFVLPIYEIADLCRLHGKPLIIDASQSAGIIEINATKLQAAFIAMPGHKALYGPQGTGLLLCNHETKPLIHGGSGSGSKSIYMPDHLPDRLEAGTHNVPGIAGLCAGISFVKEIGCRNICKHDVEMLNLMINELQDTNYELFTGSDQLGVLSLRHKDFDCEQIAEHLNERGICVRAGIHCSPIAHESAGTYENGTVRFSYSYFTDEREILTACSTLKSLIK